MASDDVIELGSSDEETEPAPKRRKPPPNAMVHIPSKLPSVSVTPSKNIKPRINPACLLKGSINQAVTVTKVTKSNVNPFVNNKKMNGNPTKIPLIKPVSGVNRNLQIPIHNRTVPGIGLSIQNNTSKVINPIVKVSQKPPSKIVLNQVEVDNLKILKVTKPVLNLPTLKKTVLKNTSLPPGITIKRTTLSSQGSKSKINIKGSNSPYTYVRMANVHSANQAACSRAVYTTSLPRGATVVPTVDLDDDEPAASPATGPQWYLRPEDGNKTHEENTGNEHQDPLAEVSSQDETGNDAENEIPVEKPKKTSPKKSPLASESKTLEKTTALEKENNKEPDKTNYIEITIEDSPIKPAKTKKGFKVGAELAITIEDSPVKTTTDKADPSNSDDETDLPEDRNSKKKLEYPKTVESVQVVEIEFEPLPQEESTSKMPECSQKKLTPSKESAGTEKITVPSNSDVEKPKRVIECIDIVEIEDSPVKPVEELKMTTPKKTKPTKQAYKMPLKIETIVLDDKEKDEFSPTYLSFIKLCFQLENSEDMKKIVDKKIKAYYQQVPKEYTESEAFTDMVAAKIVAMKTSPEKMYLYIKDVVDELNLQRKLAKAQPAKEKEEQQKFLYGEESEFDSKRQRQIRKLEKTLKKLHRAIQKLEEQEVDFDDEEDSVYLLTESEDDTSAKDGKPLNKEVLLQRYKERSVRVHAKLCQLTNTKMPSEARVQIESRPGQPKGPAKRIEKWINRKVTIGTPLPFPDFHDVLRCVREANQEDRLGWNEADIMEEARDLFVRCGKKLQRRRQENEWRLAASRIPADTLDPAEDSADLKRKLEENRRVAAKKETEVFNKYADRQNQLKLEAVEIGDKEAEESPVESDEEELVEVNDSLTNKEKRKERLKRLLQEKSKVSDDKPEPEGENSQKDVIKESNAAGASTKDNEEDAKKDPPDTGLPEKPPLKSDSSNKDEKNTVKSDSSSKSEGDGNKVDSDVDELHLLEKLYSDNDYNNSIVCSSDTGSAIAISDTSSVNDKMSGDERRTKKPPGDVISIENSSYSESEEKREDSSKETDADNSNTIVDQTVDENMEPKSSSKKISNKANNKEYNGYLEDILLTSSDDADDTKARKDNPVSQTCVNLRDDNISIGETLIIENRDIDGDSEDSKANNSDKNTITDGSSVEGMEIGPIEINSEDQGRLDNIVEIASVESLEEENTNKFPSAKSPEANEERSPAEITNIDSVETIEDENSNTENVDETFIVKAKENIDGNINETEINSVESMDYDNINEACETVKDEMPIQSIGDVSMNELLQDVINTIENNEGNKETDERIKENDFETKEDGTIPSNEEEQIQDVIETENTDKSRESIPAKETKDNNNSTPEAMEVDSLEQTL